MYIEFSFNNEDIFPYPLKIYYQDKNIEYILIEETDDLKLPDHLIPELQDILNKNYFDIKNLSFNLKLSSNERLIFYSTENYSYPKDGMIYDRLNYIKIKDLCPNLNFLYVLTMKDGKKLEI